MRLHSKPWAEPELKSSAFFIEPDTDHTGRWRELFDDPSKPFHVEIGCGKCVQAALAAKANPDINYLAIDEVRKILAAGCREVKNVLGDRPKNLLLTWADAMMLTDTLSEKDRAERIYISFPNPWTKRLKQHKRRLTHPRQLMLYREILTEKGEIWFKTDDPELFEDSLGYFSMCGFEILYCTGDLHADLSEGKAPAWLTNHESEHERMFTARGMPIHCAIARIMPMSPE